MPLLSDSFSMWRRRTESRPRGGGLLDRSAALLLGAPFVLSIALLALNDAALKPAVHDWLTGKLSDFAGLFALPVLVVALTGCRRRVACWGTAVAFVVWKSPVATPVIAAWNAHAPWRVARVLDYSDLIALVAVVWAHRYLARRGEVRVAPPRSLALGMVVTGLSVAAVVGDSIVRFYPTPDSSSVELPVTRAAAIDRLRDMGLHVYSVVHRRRNDRRPFPVDTVDVWQPSMAMSLLVELAEAPESRTMMRLVAATATPNPDAPWHARARETFEREVVAPLRSDFESRDSLVAGDGYRLRKINGRAPPVAVPDSSCGGRITSATIDVRHSDTLDVSVSRTGAANGCTWRSYARLVRRAGGTEATFYDFDPGIHGEGVVLGEWRVIAVGSDLYLERVQGRPILGVGTDLEFRL